MQAFTGVRQSAWHVGLTEQDGDSNETQDSSQNQPSDTQSVVVCKEVVVGNEVAWSTKIWTTLSKCISDRWSNLWEEANILKIKTSVVTKVKWVILHCGHTPEVGQSKQANGDWQARPHDKQWHNKVKREKKREDEQIWWPSLIHTDD